MLVGRGFVICLFWVSWGLLEVSWWNLAYLWGALEVLLGALGGMLEAPGGPREMISLGTILGHSWDRLEGPRAVFGASWEPPGRVLEASWSNLEAPLGGLGASWGTLGTSWSGLLGVCWFNLIFD